NPPVFSITVYFSIRGLMLFLKRKDIVEFVNDLDRECPRDLASQLDMEMDKTYQTFWQRYRFIWIYSHVGGPLFCLMPHEQLLGGWMPFGVRNDPNFYFLVWFVDVMCTTCGVSFFVTFDNLFNVMQGHLIMHLGHLARQISELDPRQSLTNEVQFFEDLRYNEIFKVAFLVSNFLGAGSLCFYLFVLSETLDILTIAQYILPTFVLVGFTFEICLRGTQLEEASEGLESALRCQEWYMGSRRYRKFYLLWLQYCQRTQKLGAFGLIEVNMVHFTEFLMNFWHFSADSFEKSPLVRLAAITYFGLVFLSLISCMGCAYRRQDRICNMIEKLLKLEGISTSWGYRVPKSKKRFLNILMITICRNWWRLESGLEMVILDPKPISDQLCRLRRLQALFQTLIDLTDEVCFVFRFVFLCYLMRNVWSGIRVGYMMVRVFLGHSAIESELEYLQMVFVTCIQPLLFSLMMNTLTHTADSLLETTKEAIRGLYGRDLEWFSLQLAEQHTYVHIFGAYRMNRSLAFDGCSVILLHVIYMVQCEYSSMF
ncbi:hypothetical protein M5D96_001759, partial [Drosophila gunungcola]